MTTREKIFLVAGFLIGLVTVTMAAVLAMLRHEPGSTIGAAKTPTLEIAEGVSFELTDGPVWYEHADPRTATKAQPQEITFGRTNMTMTMRAEGCSDLARAAEDDLSGERRRQFADHGLTAANLADARIGGALGEKDQHSYRGYCLRDSRNDLTFTKLFLSVGPQCLIFKSQAHQGNECPDSELADFVRTLRFRE